MVALILIATFTGLVPGVCAAYGAEPGEKWKTFWTVFLVGFCVALFMLGAFMLS